LIPNKHPLIVDEMKNIVYRTLIISIMSSFLIFLSDQNLNAQKNALPDVLPAPDAVKFNKGHFTLDKNTKIVIVTTNDEISHLAQYFTNQIQTLNKLTLSVLSASGSTKNTIVLKTDYKSDKKEAYSLDISKNEVVINGASAAGLFYGIQTFLQLINPQHIGEHSIQLACMEIKDEPAFAWRGMHLDVCRHFFPIEFVKKMIDMLAMLKMNTFHWHLTDDQGWRIEIKRYPKLTEIGGWRDETLIGHYTETGQKFDGIRYGGFYTQEQIKDVVKYAQSRYVTIVPEIEMPGHAVAALSAYPEYSCTGGPFKVYTTWGVSDDVYCAGKEGTFEFLENILDEVTALFPGKYLHIGGDECPKTRWKACPACQKRIKDEGLKDELELQSYFVKRIERFVSSKGKNLIGWDEILEGGLPERATVMSWRGYEGGLEAAQSGHDVVMTPGDFCYFDKYQGKENEEPLTIGGFLPLEKVYAFNPIPPALSKENTKHVLGAQANMWSEYLPNEKQVEYMVFPRLCAMAEILWTPRDKQNYMEFLPRLELHLKRLQKLGVNYRPLK
jgi:hexosaminidase